MFTDPIATTLTAAIARVLPSLMSAFGTPAVDCMFPSEIRALWKNDNCSHDFRRTCIPYLFFGEVEFVHMRSDEVDELRRQRSFEIDLILLTCSEPLMRAFEPGRESALEDGFALGLVDCGGLEVAVEEYQQQSVPVVHTIYGAYSLTRLLEVSFPPGLRPTPDSPDLHH
jgi:hypothetical protein